MCPLVVESSISSSPLLLAVNDGQSQSHQLDSTSSTGNHVALSLISSTYIIYIINAHLPGLSDGRPTFRAKRTSNVEGHGCQKHLNT